MSNINPRNSIPTPPKKFYVKAFWTKIIIAVVNIGIGIIFYVDEDPQSAGMWIFFAGIWLGMAGLDRGKILKAELSESSHSDFMDHHNTKK